MRAALSEEVREDIRVATETLWAKRKPPFSSTDEFVEECLAEADALARRREMLVVKTCPHCGEVLP